MFTDPINLKKKIKKRNIFTFIILESKYFLIKINKKIILKYFRKKKYKKKELIINNEDDWKNIINMFKKQDLFAKKKIFFITINSLFISINTKLYMNQIRNYSNKKIINILFFPKLIYSNFNLVFFKNYIENSGIIINNSNTYIKNIHFYINQKIKKKILIKENAKKILLKKKYRNISFFINFLKNIFLLYPKTVITKKMILNFYKSTKTFNYIDWLISILKYKKKRSIKILNILEKQKYDYLILIKSYKILLYFIIYKQEKKNFNNIFINSKKHINQIKKIYLSFLIKIKNIKTIQLALKLLKKIELCILNNEKKKIIWMHLKTLSIIFN
ncbi:hypothetical protein [Buchnera aphidicola]|uniref:DNA polymerase III, d subunit n=1 Tax=Buchnera aphidicola subsp. Cinara cedri (strain Cc) TaxID=372461 RepID=Q057G2_BUCCC|nr:hypothetical protein [Buchnera aphidicola]ABJ90737.1 DNA polymerase III, d subunit [Buchnera aphidicola BCc]